MPDDNGTSQPAATQAPSTPELSPGVQRIVDGAAQRQQEGKHPQLGANHWLLELVMRHGAMAEDMGKGLEAESLKKYLFEQLRQGNTGDPLDKETVLARAVEHARARGKDQPSERDLAAVILAASGYEVVESTPFIPSAGGSAAVVSTTPTPTSTPVRPSSDGAQDGNLTAAPTAGPPVSNAYQPRTRRPTPTLEQYGRDLTKQASEGKLSPVIGRQQEVELMLETLCRRTKRNPVLVGPAGVGKTAIVEGLALRVVHGDVPEELKNVRVLALQPSTLVAGASMVGELEKRMRAILTEASQDGLILFIDEVHSMIGSGGMAGTGDVASLLKPALARGDMAVIAATTDDEYRRFIEPDAALERRFQPIRVQELTPEETLQVLLSIRDELSRLRNVTVPDEVLRRLVDFAQQFMRNRHFPDKAVDLLEQVVAYAVTHNRRDVTEADAEAVVQRVVGMPLDLNERLDSLRAKLTERGILKPTDVEVLANRLNVTMRGLDLRLARPNAVVLLAGEAADAGEALADMVAVNLFGSEERVIAIDFSRFVHPADVSSLIGAPPGYIGYSDSLPLHRVQQMPWCVLLCQNIDACHPIVREVFTQALADGAITEATGKRIYLSDTVVILTMSVEAGPVRPLGFQQTTESRAQDVRAIVGEALGDQLVDQVDLICSEVPTEGETQRHWIEKYLLSDLSERYSKQGVQLEWDDTLIEWLLSKQGTHSSQRDWERLVDEDLSPVLVRYLPAATRKEVKSLLVKYGGDPPGITVDEA